MKVDPKYLMSVLKYNKFVATWKKAEHLQRIKLAKFEPGFAQCNTCREFKDKLKKTAKYIYQENMKKNPYFDFTVSKGEKEII